MFHFYSAIIILLLALPSAGAINCPVDEANQNKDVVKIIRKIPDGDERHCTGTLVQGGCYVLTAGHCTKIKGNNDNEPTSEAKAFTIKSGPHSETSLPSVQQVFLHPDYKHASATDVALLKLSKCVGGGLDIDFSAFSSERNITVGGYGVTKLNSFTPQMDRHMGKNKIASFDTEKICLKKVTISDDGKKVLDGDGCEPAGMDSGSAFLMNNKIRGVFNSGTEKWLADGTTLNQGCGVNIRYPSTKAFIESVIGAQSTQPAQDKTVSGSR